MVQSTEPEDDSNVNHPLEQVDTIVVDPDDVVAAFERNKRDETEKRNHFLRVSPPFEGQIEATLEWSEPNRRYPPEIDVKPVHLSPETFVVGDGAGSRHPDYRSEWDYPDISAERSVFRDEVDAYTASGERRDLTDEEEEEWEEWWETAKEMWEDRVRHALQKTETVTLTGQAPTVEKTIVDVRFESEK